MIKKSLLLTIFSAALTVLAWRGFLDVLVWLYLIPLLVMVLSEDIKKIILCMSVYAVVVAAFGFLFVRYYSYYVFFAAFLLFALFHIMFGVLTKLLFKRKLIPAILIPPFVWVGLYYVFGFSVVDNFWLDISAFHSEAAPLVWYVGSLGVTFIILLFSSSIAFFILRKKKSYLAIVIIVVVVMSSCFLYSSLKVPEGEKLKVALIQGNFPQSWEYRTKNAKTEIFSVYKNLTYKALEYDPDLISWPEYSIPADIFKDKVFYSEFLSFAKDLNKDLILGSLSKIDNRTEYDVALLFQEDSESVLEYKSVKPVPYEVNTKAYSRLETLNAKFSKFGVLLCYEETQPELAREHANNGAEFFMALSNDNRFRETNGVFLSSLSSRMVAAENGKYLVRTTNTGISQVVNPYGKVEAEMVPFKRDAMIAEIHLNSSKTFYAKYGNLLVNVAVLFLIIAMIVVYLKRRLFIRK